MVDCYPDQPMTNQRRPTPITAAHSSDAGRSTTARALARLGAASQTPFHQRLTALVDARSCNVSVAMSPAPTGTADAAVCVRSSLNDPDAVLRAPAMGVGM